MRFCDFFTRYKNGLSGIESDSLLKRPLKDIFKNLIETVRDYPKYRRIAISIMAILYMICLILYVLFLNNKESVTVGLAFVATFMVMYIVMLVVIEFDSKKENQEKMLENDEDYSKKRMDMLVKLLGNYGININDVDSINLLIDEAKNAQIPSDHLAYLEKHFKILGTTVVAIFAFVAKEICDNSTLEGIINMATYAVQFCVAFFAVAVLIKIICKEFFYSEYKKYDELIYDLRQVKIFYSKKAASSSNPQNSHAAVNE